MNLCTAAVIDDDPPLLSVRALAKSYGGALGCRNVCFDLWPGEVLGIVGESGSGKSTLLNCLSGQIDADDGEILYRDRTGETADFRTSHQGGCMFKTWLTRGGWEPFKTPCPGTG